jgi:hypothetical protein
VAGEGILQRVAAEMTEAPASPQEMAEGVGQTIAHRMPLLQPGLVLRLYA